MEPIILDIRTACEHGELRIKGSLNLDFSVLSQRSAARLLPDKSRPVWVYCRAGVHSKTAVAMLRRYGYNAVDIGSIYDWSGEVEGRLA